MGTRTGVEVLWSSSLVACGCRHHHRGRDPPTEPHRVGPVAECRAAKLSRPQITSGCVQPFDFIRMNGQALE